MSCVQLTVTRNKDAAQQNLTSQCALIVSGQRGRSNGCRVLMTCRLDAPVFELYTERPRGIRPAECWELTKSAFRCCVTDLHMLQLVSPKGCGILSRLRREAPGMVTVCSTGIKLQEECSRSTAQWPRTDFLRCLTKPIIHVYPRNSTALLDDIPIRPAECGLPRVRASNRSSLW